MQKRCYYNIMTLFFYHFLVHYGGDTLQYNTSGTSHLTNMTHHAPCKKEQLQYDDVSSVKNLGKRRWFRVKSQKNESIIYNNMRTTKRTNTTIQKLRSTKTKKKSGLRWKRINIFYNLSMRFNRNNFTFLKLRGNTTSHGHHPLLL
jgi:hypothetical protein